MIRLKFSQKLYRHVSRTYKLYSTTIQKDQPEVHFPRKIFSGIQPTGAIHLGNYLGAIAQWVKLQENDEDMILSVVDMHSITLPQDPKTLSNNVLEITATLLACGIDPDKVILFQQSMVPAHTQLSWCLGCICTMARLAHLPTYKEKSVGLKDIPLGLFVYPILQAADILAYKATHVPVGEDQTQNIELTQDLARMFNKRYGANTFPIPRSLITGSEYSRLKSLRDPAKKMSKSDGDPKSRICLNDHPDEILKKIKKSVTDFTSEVFYEPESRPGISNLISIHSFVTGKTVDEICDDAKNLNTGRYKLVVAEAVIAHLQPIQQRISQYLNEPEYLLAVLKSGAEKASVISEKTVEEVKGKLGLGVVLSKKEKLKINI